MAKKLTVGLKAAEESDLRGRFLWTPREGKVRVKILVNESSIISGDICRFINPDNEEVLWIPLEENDPIYSLDKAPQFSVILPVQVKRDDGTKETRYLRGPKSFFKLLRSLVAKNGSLKGQIVDVESAKGKDFIEYKMTHVGFSKVEETDEELVEPILNNIKSLDRAELLLFLSSKKIKISTRKEEEL